MEVPKDKNEVPHYLPGKNPCIEDFAKLTRAARPCSAARRDVPRVHADGRTAENESARRVPPSSAIVGAALTPPQRPRCAQRVDRDRHVQGNVHMIVGAGANIAVQVGDDGVLVVDTGAARRARRCWRRSRQLSDKEIRWIINTTRSRSHGRQRAVSQAGRTVNGNLAAIVAHENVLARMTAAEAARSPRAAQHVLRGARDFPFNGEAVILYHVPSAHSDGDIVVYFRRSDVIVAGDCLRDDRSIRSSISQTAAASTGSSTALNRMLDLAVPSKICRRAAPT